MWVLCGGVCQDHRRCSLGSGGSRSMLTQRAFPWRPFNRANSTARGEICPVALPWSIGLPATGCEFRMIGLWGAGPGQDRSKIICHLRLPFHLHLLLQGPGRLRTECTLRVPRVRTRTRLRPCTPLLEGWPSTLDPFWGLRWTHPLPARLPGHWTLQGRSTSALGPGS